MLFILALLAGLSLSEATRVQLTPPMFEGFEGENAETTTSIGSLDDADSEASPEEQGWGLSSLAKAVVKHSTPTHISINRFKAAVNVTRFDVGSKGMTLRNGVVRNVSAGDLKMQDVSMSDLRVKGVHAEGMKLKGVDLDTKITMHDSSIQNIRGRDVSLQALRMQDMSVDQVRANNLAVTGLTVDNANAQFNTATFHDVGVQDAGVKNLTINRFAAEHAKVGMDLSGTANLDAVHLTHFSLDDVDVGSVKHIQNQIQPLFDATKVIVPLVETILVLIALLLAVRLVSDVMKMCTSKGPLEASAPLHDSSEAGDSTKSQAFFSASSGTTQLQAHS